MSPPLLVYNKGNTPPMSSNTLESFNSSGSCCPKGFSNLQMYKKSTRNVGQGSINKCSEVRQRVTSARINRLRTLQNQLSDAHGQIGELLNENRLLRTIHKRQDSALSRYEDSNADLPQLLNSHAEEIRAWQIRCRNLQSQNRELSNKLKQKDTIILTLNDHNRRLSQLNIDKNLEERDKLSERVRNLETQVAEKDEELKVLHRRIQLEAKGYKQQINSGILKQKELMMKLDKANTEILRIGEAIRTESIIIPGKMSLGSYLRNTSTMASKNLSSQKRPELQDRLANGGGDSTKKDVSANGIKSTTKSPPASSISSKTITRNISQHSSDAFPLMKSFMANKPHRSKLTLSSNIKNTIMDFTDIKYSNLTATKSPLQNSSSVESSDTIHSTSGRYDDDEFETSSASHTYGKSELNNQSDTMESDELSPDITQIDSHLNGDYNSEKFQSYSDQRYVPESGDAFGVKRHEDFNRNEIKKIQKELHTDINSSEAFLESFCESITNDVNISKEKTKIPVRPTIMGREILTKKERVNSSTTNKKPLDPTKKKELLTALRSTNGIDD